MVGRTNVHDLGDEKNGLEDGKSELVFRKVRCESQAADEALKVTLFRGGRGDACGWYIGPLVADQGRLSLPFLPRSEETMASVAVVRAIRIAKKTRSPVCLVDPDDLWESAWQA